MCVYDIIMNIIVCYFFLFNLKSTTMRSVAWLCPDPLGELTEIEV